MQINLISFKMPFKDGISKTAEWSPCLGDIQVPVVSSGIWKVQRYLRHVQVSSVPSNSLSCPRNCSHSNCISKLLSQTGIWILVHAHVANGHHVKPPGQASLLLLNNFLECSVHFRHRRQMQRICACKRYARRYRYIISGWITQPDRD